MGKDAALTTMNDSAGEWAGRVLSSMPARYTMFSDPVDNTYRAEANSRGGTDYEGATFETVINAVIDVLTASGGGKIFLREGTYRCSALPVYPKSNVWIQGSGIGLTTLKTTAGLAGGDADIIRVTKTAPYYSNIRISDMTIDHQDSTISGNGICMQGCDYPIIENVKINSPYLYGIVLGTVGGTGTKIVHPILHNVLVTGERNGNDAIGGGGITQGDFRNIWLLANAGTGWDTTNTEHSSWDGIYIKNTALTAGTWGLSHDFGAKFNTYDNFHIENCYYGFYVGSDVSGDSSNLKLNNFYITTTDSNGIDIRGSTGHKLTNVQISSGEITAWDGSALGTNGINVQESDYVTIDNVQIHNPTSPDSYGIHLAADAGGTGCTEVDIQQCNIYGTANKIYEQSVSSSTICNNRGYITENSGTSSIASGTTHTDDIDHGLSYTPSAKEFSIIFTEQPTNDPGEIAIANIDSAHFDVYVRNDPGASNLDFAWSVRRHRIA